VRSGSTSVIVVALFSSLLALSVLFGYLPLSVLVVYGGMSLLTFIVYFMDKSAARRGTWRISEKTLHVFSLLCGWPGALMAQQLLRHKSKKTEFRIVFWLTVLGNCAALIWLKINGYLLW